MKVINIEAEIRGTEREVQCPKGGFVSLRPLLEKDGMGFSLHKTIIPKNGVQRWHYTKHKEACYCVSGYGELANLETNEKFQILPDTLYVLDNYDNHTFEAFSDEVILISIFNPPCTGLEVHDENGSY